MGGGCSPRGEQLFWEGMDIWCVTLCCVEQKQFSKRRHRVVDLPAGNPPHPPSTLGLTSNPQPPSAPISFREKESRSGSIPLADAECELFPTVRLLGFQLGKLIGITSATKMSSGFVITCPR